MMAIQIFILYLSNEHSDLQHPAMANVSTRMFQANAQGVGVSDQKTDRNVE